MQHDHPPTPTSRAAGPKALSKKKKGTRGGIRPGAGRPPLPWRDGAPHRKLPEIDGWTALHITFSRLSHLENLRKKQTMLWTLKVFQDYKERPGFRIVAWSVQPNHVHMLVEAQSGDALTRAMRGLLARLAKGWNKIWGRKGAVFAGRYFVRTVKNRKDARNLLAYVLKNHIRHGWFPEGVFDGASSTFWMDVWLERTDWKEERGRRGFQGVPPPIVPPLTQVLLAAIRPGAISIYGRPCGYRRDQLTPAGGFHHQSP